MAVVLACSQAAAAAGRRGQRGRPIRFRGGCPLRAVDGDFEWLNTTKPLMLEDLRGKFVLLDFWTFCCINCMHVLPELKKLEQAYPNELVVIGVHSAKFEGEQDIEQHPRGGAAVRDRASGGERRRR